MKSSAPSAIVLTIFMFLLVLIAAVFFWLYYEQQNSKNDLQSANDNLRVLEAQQAENEVNNLATQAALDIIMATSTSTAAENVERANQLVNSDQLKATMESKEAQLSSDLQDANATVKAFEALAPLVTVVEPQADAFIIVGQPVELVIVASDNAGVSDISFTIGGDPTLHGGPIADAAESAIKRLEWTPPGEGDFEIKITATNINGSQSRHSTTLTVVASPTSTPQPTDTSETTSGT